MRGILTGGFHNGTWMKGFGPFKNRNTGWMDEPGDEDPLDEKANELYLRWLQVGLLLTESRLRYVSATK